MQQLNSLYRGDQSESLSNIMGVQYAPQAQLGKFTNDLTMTGMSLANATNRTAMQLSSQEGITNRQLRQQNKQFIMSNDLAHRTQDEAELNGMATRGYNAGMLNNSNKTTDFNTGGNIDIADNEAAAQVETMLSAIDIQIQNLDPNDRNYAAKVAALQGRRNALAEQMKVATGRGRGGASGAAKAILPELRPTLNVSGKPTTSAIPDYTNKVTDRVDAQNPLAPEPKRYAVPGNTKGGYQDIAAEELKPFTPAASSLPDTPLESAARKWKPSFLTEPEQDDPLGLKPLAGLGNNPFPSPLTSQPQAAAPAATTPPPYRFKFGGLKKQSPIR